MGNSLKIQKVLNAVSYFAIGIGIGGLFTSAIGDPMLPLPVSLSLLAGGAALELGLFAFRKQ